MRLSPQEFNECKQDERSLRIKRALQIVFRSISEDNPENNQEPSQQSPLPPVFPPELMDMIFNLSDHKELRTCALVCKTWLAASRCRIFATVRVSHPNNVFFDLLPAQHCSVKPYIRHLEVSHGKTCDRVATLERLPALESLTVDAVQPMQIAQCNKLIANFDWLRELHISYVDFQSLAALSRLVCGFPALEHLSMDRVRLRTEFEERGVDKLPATLQSTRLTWISCNIVDWLYGSCTSSAIHTVHLAHFDLMQPSDNYLQAIGTNLRHLSLTFSDSINAQAVYPNIDLSIHPSLLTIELRGIYSTSHAKYYTRLLGQITSPEIEHITLRVHDVTTVDWPVIDRLLMTPVFAKLRCVLCIVGDFFHPSAQVSRLKEGMILCQGRGILQVEYYC